LKQRQEPVELWSSMANTGSGETILANRLATIEEKPPALNGEFR
jgi:hypothetical protein